MVSDLSWKTRVRYKHDVNFSQFSAGIYWEITSYLNMVAGQARHNLEHLGCGGTWQKQGRADLSKLVVSIHLSKSVAILILATGASKKCAETIDKTWFAVQPTVRRTMPGQPPPTIQKHLVGYIAIKWINVHYSYPTKYVHQYPYPDEASHISDYLPIFDCFCLSTNNPFSSIFHSGNPTNQLLSCAYIYIYIPFCSPYIHIYS